MSTHSSKRSCLFQKDRASQKNWKYIGHVKYMYIGQLVFPVSLNFILVLGFFFSSTLETIFLLTNRGLHECKSQIDFNDT